MLFRDTTSSVTISFRNTFLTQLFHDQQLRRCVWFVDWSQMPTYLRVQRSICSCMVTTHCHFESKDLRSRYYIYQSFLVWRNQQICCHDWYRHLGENGNDCWQLNNEQSTVCQKNVQIGLHLSDARQDSAKTPPQCICHHKSTSFQGRHLTHCPRMFDVSNKRYRYPKSSDIYL